MNRLAALLSVVLCTTPWAGAENFAIVGATVHTLTSNDALENATVLIEDGVISAVGRNVSVPDGTTVIDGRGKVVTPGVFDAYSSLGLVEVSAVDDSVDESHAGRYGAGFDIANAINPRSTVIGINRVEGVTRALVLPSAPREGGGVMAGQGAVIALHGGRDYLIKRGAAVVAYLGDDGAALAGGSRAAALQMLKEALQDANDYNQHRNEFEEGARRDYVVNRVDLEALLPVVSGRTPLLVHANRRSDIEALIDLKSELDLKIVIAGGAEAWQVAAELAQARIGVIVQPLTNLPGSFDMLNATLANAARLHKAGVLIAFAGSDSHNSRNLTQAAGNAVANGLPWTEALRAITVNVAQLLELDEDCCTLTPGVTADVVLWSGDPLEVTTFADDVFVAGARMDRHSRQTLLRDRYRHLNKVWPPAYPSR